MNVTYNGTHVPGNISLISIYSRNDDLPIPYNTSRLEGANNIVMDGYGHGVIDNNLYILVKTAVLDQPTTRTTTTPS